MAKVEMFISDFKRPGLDGKVLLDGEDVSADTVGLYIGVTETLLHLVHRPSRIKPDGSGLETYAVTVTELKVN